MNDLKVIRQIEILLNQTINRINELELTDYHLNHQGLYYSTDAKNRVTELAINFSRQSSRSLAATEIVELVSRLANIKKLSLAGLHIAQIEKLGNLKGLTHLYLWANRISDIAQIGALSNLVDLNIGGNNISDISPITKLTKLKKLWAWGNNIMDIESLRNLVSLTYLSLHGNVIKDLSSLSELHNLETLLLDRNKISSIEPLKQLERLGKITLSDNKIHTLPEWFFKNDLEILLKPGDYREPIAAMYIGNNPLSSPPIEIINQGKTAITAWFKEGEKISVNEVKVILVGHGEVGKTTLVKCLTGQKPNPKEPTTHRIIITNYKVSSKKKDIKLNFWDFGGQDVMHSTHQFFMSKRSVYILLLDGRKDEDPEYWLNLIKSFGGSSPVLIVMNKVDTNPSFDVDRRFLKKKYPFIAGFNRTICLGKISGIKELKRDLINTLDKVEILSTLWRKDWLEVKNAIEKIRADFLSQQGYDAICAKYNINSIEDKEILADFLNDLGAVVHFRDLRLKNLHILQPQWASRAAYKVINSKLVADNSGTLKTE